MSPTRQFLFHVRDVNRCLNADVSLDVSAQRARRSRFQFHRLFHRAAGETLKQYTLRLRLERAAARLAVGDETVLAIALSVGFASHEVFTRAFRRHFNMSPSQYRTRLVANVSRLQRMRHLELTQAIGPCIRLFRYSPASFNQSKRNLSMSVPSIVRKEISPQNVLFIRRRIARSELQGMLAECFGKLYTHSQKLGLPLAGFPLARYVSTARGLWTVEAAVPLAAPASAEGEMEAGVLPGGPVAFAVHEGQYETLWETNAAIERWIEANGFRVGGAPWEWYVTDPGEHPDPADWRTEVYWPLEK
jgi:AraC family transcriptional regulator